jgi:hypothetical protein
MYKRIAVGILGLLCALLAVAPTEALPNRQGNTADLSLIFVAEPTKGQQILMRLTLANLEAKPFYAPPGNGLRRIKPLSWSPNGETLAFFMQTYDAFGMAIANAPPQICFLNKLGLLQSCLDGYPAMEFSLGLDQLAPIAWSADSNHIFLPIQTETSMRLVSVNVFSGAIQAVLYTTYLRTDSTFSFTWDAGAHYVIDGLGNHEQSLYQTQAKIINLETGQSIQLDQKLLPYEETRHLQYICPHVSPNGAYFVAMPNSRGRGLAVIDKAGEVVRIVSHDTPLGALNFDCPTWSADTGYMVMIGFAEGDERARLFRYTMATGALEVLYRVPSTTPLASGQGELQGQVKIAPDNATFVAESPFSEVALEGTSLLIIDSAQQGQAFTTGVGASDPLWVPMQNAPSPAPTIRP